MDLDHDGGIVRLRPESTDSATSREGRRSVIIGKGLAAGGAGGGGDCGVSGDGDGESFQVGRKGMAPHCGRVISTTLTLT